MKETQTGPCPVLWQTPFGDLWADWENEATLEMLVDEQQERRFYQNDNVAVEPGDVVVDIGGHLGTFTAAALQKGAAQVVVFEPDPANIVCLEQSFADEIRQGRVHLVEAAAWHEPGILRFRSDENTVMSRVEASGDLEVRATTVDIEVNRLGLDQLDFLKMDIEGAERHALAGARETLAHFAPSMAICVYHKLDDPEVVAEVVLDARPDYTTYKTREIHYFDIAN